MYNDDKIYLSYTSCRFKAIEYISDMYNDNIYIYIYYASFRFKAIVYILIAYVYW